MAVPLATLSRVVPDSMTPGVSLSSRRTTESKAAVTVLPTASVIATVTGLITPLAIVMRGWTANSTWTAGPDDTLNGVLVFPRAKRRWGELCSR